MHGPIAARTGPVPRARSAATPASTTPSNAPRQPAWIAATAVSLARPIGAQSAPRATSGRSVAVVALPSASSGSGRGGVDLEHVGSVHVERSDPPIRAW